MARKPLDQLSPAYRRRVEKAEAQGKSRQQARGHKQAEHKSRALHNRERGELTSAERQEVRRFANKQAARASKDAGPIYEKMVAYIKRLRGGMGPFRAIKDEVKRLEREYKRAKYVKVGKNKWVKRVFEDGEAGLSRIAHDYAVADIEWMFYH